MSILINNLEVKSILKNNRVVRAVWLNANILWSLTDILVIDPSNLHFDPQAYLSSLSFGVKATGPWYIEELL